MFNGRFTKLFVELLTKLKSLKRDLNLKTFMQNIQSELERQTIGIKNLVEDKSINEVLLPIR